MRNVRNKSNKIRGRKEKEDTRRIRGLVRGKTAVRKKTKIIMKNKENTVIKRRMKGKEEEAEAENENMR